MHGAIDADQVSATEATESQIVEISNTVRSRSLEAGAAFRKTAAAPENPARSVHRAKAKWDCAPASGPAVSAAARRPRVPGMAGRHIFPSPPIYQCRQPVPAVSCRSSDSEEAPGDHIGNGWKRLSRTGSAAENDPPPHSCSMRRHPRILMVPA